MHRLEASDGRGTVVIVHGAFEHAGRYHWLAEQWQAHGYNVLYGDLPGQGQSTRRRGHIRSFNEYIEQVSSWVHAAHGQGGPVFLLGHSMGGLAVIRTLQEKPELPVRGVILSSPCLGIVNQPNRIKRTLGKGLNYVAPSMLVKGASGTGKATRNEDVLTKDKEDTLMLTKVSVRWFNELNKAVDLAHKKHAQFPDVPLLVLQAGEDYYVQSDRTLHWFNHLNIHEKSYKEWESLYHEVFNEPEREDVFRYAETFARHHLRK
ncbi:phospholipase [Pontibacillus halophilus JSM 076056 = DSM 19796]|uniref:Phospholipase n=1 Tax=Pontibacillus halophilus JSM 076056 = DSM 19796 TaxID=1385510 RepID=A0A0A5GE80_9BACI|nr:alpha/beta hydrolase [Pontibacillus halophilus]KGX89503.1 phospholipase [Pontibacillus halophilus JSM 076056 = DSM 19796]